MKPKLAYVARFFTPSLFRGLLFGAFAMVLTVALIPVIQAALQFANAAQWPTTSGVITNVEAEVNQGGRDRSVSISIAYEYRVGREAYVGRHLGCEYEDSIDGRARDKFFRDYALGTRVDVYYDPEQPGVSCLDTDTDNLLLFAVAIAGLLWLEAVIDMRHWLKELRSG
jgi:hypothetical protein